MEAVIAAQEEGADEDRVERESCNLGLTLRQLTETFTLSLEIGTFRLISNS